MNDFDFDAMQKKRIAQGARHKKNGSKSHGCTLPSDLLTEAQKRKLNGPVVTLKLDEPMTWKDFKALPEDKRRLYAEHIKELYNPSWKQWGQLFHTHPNTVRQHFIRYAIADARGRGASTTRADLARWDAFCNGVVGGRPGTPVNTAIEAADDTVEPVNDAVEAEEPVENAVPVTPGKAKSVRDETIDDLLQLNYVPVAQSVKPAVPGAFRFTLNGVNDWESVFALLRGIPLPEKADIAIAVRTGK